MFNGEMRNLENRVEILEKRENGASASIVVYFGDHFFKGYEDNMDLVNTGYGIDECIVFGSLDSYYPFLDVMYQHLSSNKHTVSELTYIKKFGYRQNKMTVYLSAMNDMPELFSAT